jgi:hypothetical protein
MNAETALGAPIQGQLRRLEGGANMKNPSREKIEFLKSKYDPPAEERISDIVDTFYFFLSLLEGVKEFTPEERKKLTDALPPPDVGYVISFLNNLYNEDRISSWIFTFPSPFKRSRR